MCHYGRQHSCEVNTSMENYIRISSLFLFSYDAFDFHKECSRMRWHRLSILIDRLASQQARFGYYMSSTEGVILGWQGGVFRTNCMDCLDR